MFKGTKNAFTLAEVLITLGIIGVVAAMTMPTLMGSTQEAQYKTAFKKQMSVIGQAINIAVAQNGEDLSSSTAQTNPATAANTTGNIVNVLSNGLSRTNRDVGTLGSGHTFDGSTSKQAVKGGAYNAHFYLQDGTSVHAASGSSACTFAAPCSILIDTNGVKGPNQINATATSAGTGNTAKRGYCRGAVATTGTQYNQDPTGASTNGTLGSMTATNGRPCTATAMISDQFEVLVWDNRIMPRDSVGLYVFYGAK